ncbi:hypothetical protein ABZ671_25345 [Micromonospora sp. NPDC006766]|uniref:hypothetical protein n=1 Tax=Micromonospora sp. NPDC006766 TaxID=3154778 RepID=UPI00340F1B6A
MLVEGCVDAGRSGERERGLPRRARWQAPHQLINVEVFLIVKGVGRYGGLASFGCTRLGTFTRTPTPGEGGVPQPVGGDALHGDPGQALPDAFPQVVVAAAADRPTIAVAQQPIGGPDGTVVVGVGA